MHPRITSRRSVLATGVAVLGTLAGCVDGSPSDPSNRDTTRESDTQGETDMSNDLDLREANVTDVEIDSRENGTYRFDVTLYHDDDGEDGYADWWQVERLDGTQLGRRTLLHAHSTAPFTRSETIDIPSAVSCVVVRGHDQQHGYGGQAALVTVESGATRLVRQGSESRSFEGADCP